MERQVEITTIDGQTDTVTVRKLALGDYADLLRAVKKLPAEIVKFIDDNDKSALQDLDLKAFVPQLLPMIANSLDEFCDVLAVPTDKDGEYFRTKVDLPDSVDVLVAAFELNDISRVINAVKKLTARKSTPAPADQEQTQPETETSQQPKTT